MLTRFAGFFLAFFGFGIFLQAQPANDNFGSAFDVSALLTPSPGGCSADATYTTIGATADLNAASCWNNSGPQHNVWFTFQATTTEIYIKIDVDGTKGTQRRTQLALWDNTGTGQLACDRYQFNNEDVDLGYVGLTIGNWYYISVDAYNASYDGTFTLCMEDQVDYDFYEGAVDLDGIMNSCSADAIYSTIGGSSDRNAGSCWNNSGPRFNRWFSFTATANEAVNVTVDIGGSQGTQLRTQVALWESDGTTEVACKRYQFNAEDVVVGAVGLTQGNTYYISVDSYNTSYDGTFSICINDNVDYDFYQGAIDVTGLINSCSADATYSTIGGSGDLNAGSCWNNSGPRFNRWFKFTATANEAINVTVDIGGSKGTQLRSQVALWESDGTTQIACKRYQFNTEDVVVGAVGLTQGNEYYISVDSYNTSYDGTFSLCIDDQVDYDYYEGAIDVTGIINSCSADAAYTTIGGSGDRNAGSCWNNSGPRFNRWFKFTATATGNINVTVDIGGSKGTQLRSQVALWESDGTTEVACKRYQFNTEDVVVGATGLTPGNEYYITVDSYNTSYDGTFSLCIDDQVDYDFYEGAIDVTGIINSCSADAAYSTIGGSGDRNSGSCWNNSGPRFNRWFKFTATASGVINVTVDIGGTKGTQLRTQAAIWESDGITEVACKRYQFNTEDVVVGAIGLTPGNEYYISVDSYNTSYDGTFSLCIDDQVDYDFYEGAYEITDTNNWCSSDAEFTTIGGSGDRNAGSCWNNSGPRFNRWFKFTATTAQINITVDIGGTKGTQLRSQVALWQSDGVTEIECKRYQFNTEDVVIGAVGLTPGSEYYISVDSYNTSYDGTFTLCVNDEVDYDYYEGAYEITDLDNWCSGDAEFTTIGGSPDFNAGSCWNNSGPRFNRWFKFDAISTNVTITVDIGGSKGTQLRTQLALWQSDGTTQVDCQRYSANGDDVSISSGALVIGNTYYISVDSYNTSYDGTFTLCVDNVDQSYFSRQDGAWNDVNTWSIVGYGGAPAPDYPQIGDIANIRDHDVTLSTNETVGGILMDNASDQTTLTITSASLTVQGQMTMQNTGVNQVMSVSMTNSTLDINDDLTLQRDGGNTTFGLTLDNSTLDINQDLNLDSNGGSTVNSTLDANNGSSIIVRQDLLMDHSGGSKFQTSINNTSTITVNRDIQFTATGDDQLELELNNSGQLFIGRDFVRGSPAYGILDCNGTSTINYSSSTYLQTFAEDAGSGTGDVFTYQNVVINNSRITAPQVTLEGAVTINGNLTLTDGTVFTTASNLLTLIDGSSTSGASDASFVDGPLKKIGATAFEFPIGDGMKWAPLGVSNFTVGDAASEFTAQYNLATYSDVTNFRNPDPNGVLNNVSTLEYWTLDNTGTAATVNVTLHWKNQSQSDIDDYDDLQIAHYNTGNSEWENFGQDSRAASDPGSITVNDVSTFSPFTFGSTSSSSNPLPVELLQFKATRSFLNESILVSWATASESNNDHFVLQKSLNGLDFIDLEIVPGMGNSSRLNEYSFSDFNPAEGIQYYRLKQVDFDGEEWYSHLVQARFDSESDITLYPNPLSGDDFTISHGPAELLKVNIYNTNGQLLHNLNKQVDQNATRTRITVPLDAGIYIVKVNTDSSHKTLKIVKN